MAELGLPGVKKGKTWVGRHLRDTRNALVVLWRWFGAPSGMLAEDGGSAVQGSPEQAVRGLQGATATKTSAKRVTENWVVLTGSRIGRGSDADEPAASSGGEAGPRSGKTQLPGCSGLLDSVDRRGMILRRYAGQFRRCTGRGRGRRAW